METKDVDERIRRMRTEDPALHSALARIEAMAQRLGDGGHALVDLRAALAALDAKVQDLGRRLAEAEHDLAAAEEEAGNQSDQVEALTSRLENTENLLDLLGDDQALRFTDLAIARESNDAQLLLRGLYPELGQGSTS